MTQEQDVFEESALADAENTDVEPLTEGDRDEAAAEVAEAPPYVSWIARRRLSEGHREAAIKSMQAWQSPPGVMVLILDDDSDPIARGLTLASLAEQLYGASEVQVCPSDDVHQIGNAIAASDCDWVQLVHAGDTLDTLALYLVADHVRTAPELQVIYSDEDTIGPEGFQDPIFRPDINLDLLRSVPYLGRSLALRRTHLLEMGGFDEDHGGLYLHDYVLRVIETDGLPAVGHIDDVTYHAALPFAQWLSRSDVAPHSAAVLGAHLDRLGVAHRLHDGPFMGSHRVEYLHEGAPPLVSVVVTAGDEFGKLTVLMESLLGNTRYPAFEVVLVDNGTTNPAVRNYLDGVSAMGNPALRVHRLEEQSSRAGAANAAYGALRGEYFLFLDVTVGVLHAEWLEVMMQHARRPEVGVVGARMHSPDSSVDSAGVILGLGGTAHAAFRGEAATAPGYMQRLQLDQNYSAIGAECLLVRRDVFVAVDGFSDGIFPNHYHAVDLCLKAREAGFLTVWTPHARVMRDTRAIAGQNAFVRALRQLSDNEHANLNRRWQPWMVRDPAYNRNLSILNTNFSLNEQRHVAWQPFAKPVLPRAVVIPGDAFGCGHYRVRQPFASMQREGKIEGFVSERYLLPVELARAEADTVVLQRQMGPSQRERVKEMKELSRAFRVFELDDYLTHIPVKSAHYKTMKTPDLPRNLRMALGMVDRFVVSTEPLAEQMSHLHSDIRVVKNRLPVDWWGSLTPSQRRVGKKPRVGWGGGSSHRGDLELIADVVRDLADEVEWVFLGMCPEKLRPYVHDFQYGVQIELYPEKMASLNLDLALAPLEDNIFNACKSNLRLMEYGACGFPVVCSDIICYRDDLPVTRVKNRYRDWMQAIRMHLSDLDATERAGDELRAAIHRNYMLTGQHLEDWAKAWLPD